MSSDYRMPGFWDKEGNRTPEDAKTGWLREAISEGTNFLKSQRAYVDLDRSIDTLFGPHDERIPRALSTVYVNRLKRIIRETVATESNLRPIWGYKSDNKAFDDQVVVLNKLVNGWWHNTFADRSIREAMQYAGVEGTGYASPIWEKDFWVTGRGDIKLHTYGPRDVLPIQLPKDHDLQRAYAVIIRTETPIAMAHAMYPLYADRIFPDRSQPGWFKRGMKKVQRFLSPALNVADQDRDREVNCPTVDIYNTYVLDLTINGSGHVIPMGDPGTSWYYEVPYVGQEIPTGIRDGSGRMLYRKATWEDCLMYPLRRLFVAVGEKAPVEVRDGPSPWWHGKAPVVKFTVDDWPYEYLGISPVRDGGSIQASINRLLRVIDDSANAKLRPALMYNAQGSLSKTDMDSFDTRQPNQRVEVDFNFGKPIEPLLPPDYYNVDPYVREHLEKLKEDLDYVMAQRDMAALAKARQLPAGDTIEKLFEVLGPIPQDISRSMERSLRDLGEMVKCLFFQWYTLPRKVQIMGSTGIVEEDYDYDPGNMIPARNADEAMTPYLERVRRHTGNFVFHVTPGSLHQITQMSRQLMLIQLWTRGFPIDPWTMAEAMDLPNFGPPPTGTKNMIERFIAWTRLRGEVATDVQVEAAQAMGAVQQAQQAQQAQAILGGGTNPPGRPPSMEKAPALAEKDGGTRSTITTS